MNILICWLKALGVVCGFLAFVTGFVIAVYWIVKLGEYIESRFRSPWRHVLTVGLFVLLLSIPVTIALCGAHK